MSNHLRIPVSESTTGTEITTLNLSTGHCSALPLLTGEEAAKEIKRLSDRLFLDQAQFLIDNHYGYGAFIILTAFLHYLAGLYAGVSNNKATQVNKEQFKCFVHDFLSGYNEHALWICLRNGFFHRGAVESSSLSVSLNVQGRHTTNGNALELDAQTFLNDLRNAKDAMLALRLSSDTTDKQKWQQVENYQNSFRPITLSS